MCLAILLLSISSVHIAGSHRASLMLQFDFHLCYSLSFFRPIREYLVHLMLLASRVFLFDYSLFTIVQLDGLHRAVM